MKVCFIGLFLTFSLSVAANDSIRSSISFKGGYTYGKGVYFGASYSYHINKLLRIAPTFVYVNTSLDDMSFAAGETGMYGGMPVFFGGRITSALTLDVQFSSRSFTSPDCKHHVLLGIGYGVLHYAWVWTRYGQKNQDPPYWSSASVTNKLTTARHVSLSYGYRIGKRVELGIFGDALMYEDFDGGVGLYCSLLF